MLHHRYRVGRDRAVVRFLGHLAGDDHRHFPVGIENLTIDEVEEIRSRCEARAAREMASDKAEARGDHKAEKVAAESVS